MTIFFVNNDVFMARAPGDHSSDPLPTKNILKARAFI